MPDRFIDQVDVAYLLRQVRERRGLGGDIRRPDGADEVDPRAGRQFARIDVGVKAAVTSTIAPSSPTGPMPSTSAESPWPRSSLGVSGSSQGGRCRIIQKICVSAFSAMVSGSASTAMSRISGGTTFMYRSRSTTYSAI